jgi:hypothetical protein
VTQRKPLEPVELQKSDVSPAPSTDEEGAARIPGSTLSPEKLHSGLIALARIAHMLESNPGVGQLH